MKSSTLSSFTSGVVTIAATIMVLQLTTPTSGDFEGIFKQWQTLIAHYDSFLLIYVLWFNHAKEFSRVEKVSPDLVIFNGIWLVFLSLIPFATGWMEHFLNSTVPQLVYSILLWVCLILSVEMNKKLGEENPQIDFSTRLALKERIPIYVGLGVTLINSFLFPFLNIIIYFIITIYLIVLIVHHRKDDVSVL